MTPPSDQNNMAQRNGMDSAPEAANLPPAPVFTRAFNGYTVPAVDAYVQRIMNIIADLQKHIDQQSLKVQDLSGQLTQQRTHVQQLESQLAQHQGDAARIQELTSQLAASTMQADRFAAELNAARSQMDAMVEKEAAGVAALKQAEQMRLQLEQEQEDLARSRAEARAEADAILEAARQQANRIEAGGDSQRQEYQAQLEEIRAQSRAQMTQMLTILKNEAGALFSESRSAAASEAEQKYHRLQEQLEQEQAQAQAEMARSREAAHAEAEALLEAARQQAQTITDETERNRHDAAARLADLYTAQEERLQTLGTECNAAITNIRQMLEAQLALTKLPGLPSAPLTVKSSQEVVREERSDEIEMRDINGNFRALWQ
jgi:DNA repair exonuclease SbcCD ATPase subunit